jgi:hypothetical protein
MFEPLFARLSDRYHLVAPDYPGFGHSGWPDPKKFAYTFDHFAVIMNHFQMGWKEGNPWRLPQETFSQSTSVPCANSNTGVSLPRVLSGNHLWSVGSQPEVQISLETTRRIAGHTGAPIKLSTHTLLKTHDGGNRRSADRLDTVSLAKISRRKGLR